MWFTRRLVKRLRRLPRRTVRIRLTMLYGGLFVLSGAALLTTTYLLVQQATAGGVPSPDPPSLPFEGRPTPGQVDEPSRIIEAAVAEQRETQLRALLVQSGIALVLMSGVSMGLGWVMAGRVLRPLRTITSTARQISATNLHERLNLQGVHDELRELGDTFDELLGRLETSFQSQHRFVANASHELRTPVAWQRTLVQVALADPDATAESLRTTSERVLVATYQQERLIDALLTLARSERGLEKRLPLDLADIARQVLHARVGDAATRGVHITQTLDPAPALGDPRLVERLVVNLVDNALQYNVDGGRLELRTHAAPGGPQLSVFNTGPDVPADQLDRLFQPFQRLGADRTHHNGGHGLGLSIVQAIASAHGATIQAEPRGGGGITITVTFPVPAVR